MTVAVAECFGIDRVLPGNARCLKITPKAAGSCDIFRYEPFFLRRFWQKNLTVP